MVNILKHAITKLIFMGRWIQAPLYLGLLVILAAYVYRFLAELSEIVFHINGYSNTDLMLGVLDLIDVVMIANLLIMVILGGYETFVSRLNLHEDPDQPDWLDEVNAGTMKVKLAIALIGISSIHLLRTFIDPRNYSDMVVMWQVVIHLTLVASAVFIALTNRMLASDKDKHKVQKMKLQH